MNTRFGASLLLSLVVAGCGFVNPWNENDVPDSTVLIENATEQNLYVGAMTEDILMVALIASEIPLSNDDPAIIAPGTSRAIPFEDISSAFGPEKTAVFTIYAADPSEEDSSLYVLANMLHRSYSDLKNDGFRVRVHATDLAYGHLFGDPYWVVTDEDDLSAEVHAPILDDSSLSAWVAFSGCSEGTFNLTHDVRDGTARLAIMHDYPDHEVDCERLNFKEVTFELAAEVLAAGRIVLLNPNNGMDPYEDAFVLKS